MKAKNCIKDLKRRERERERDLPTCRVPVLSPHCLQYTSEKVKEIQKRKRRENSRDPRRYFFVEIRTRFCSIFRSAKQSDPTGPISLRQALWIRSPSECKFESGFSCRGICDLNCSNFTVIQIKGILIFYILLSFLVRNILSFFGGFVFPSMCGILDMFCKFCFVSLFSWRFWWQVCFKI